MTSNQAREFLLPLAILVSVAVGVAIGGWLVRPTTEPDSRATPATVDTRAVVASLDDLRAEVTRLRESIDRGSTGQTATTRVEAVSGSDAGAYRASDDLRKVTESLARTAELLQSAAARVGGDRAPLVAPRTVDASRFERLWDLPEADQTKPYLLWTYQQVIDEFGLPDNVSGTGEKTFWDYTRPAGNTLFSFADGRVVLVKGIRNK